MPTISRWLASALAKGLSFQRAVLLMGARQSGKTTLVRKQCPIPAQYVTMDNDVSLLAAREDPHFFLDQYAEKCLIIDEIQKAPSLISEVKRHVDEDKCPGQFILTGSADYRKLPTAENADSLTGQVVVLRLRTLSRAEMLGALPCFIENAFKERFPKATEIEPCSRRSVYSWAIEGGYPQTIGFTAENRNLYFKVIFRRKFSTTSRKRGICVAIRTWKSCCRFLRPTRVSLLMFRNFAENSTGTPKQSPLTLTLLRHSFWLIICRLGNPKTIDSAAKHRKFLFPTAP